jgi:predicted nucleic acid binding AN1-type Zn finger protein
MNTYEITEVNKEREKTIINQIPNNNGYYSLPATLRASRACTGITLPYLTEG